MGIEPKRLERAKSALRAVAKDLPTVTFRGIPAEAFDREDLLYMLSAQMEDMARQRSRHDAHERMLRMFAIERCRT